MAYTDKVKEQVMQWFRATPDGSIDDAQHDCLIATSVSPRHGFLYECRRRVQDSIKAKQVEEAQELWHVHPDTIPDKYKVIGCFGCVHLPAEVRHQGPPGRGPGLGPRDRGQGGGGRGGQSGARGVGR